MLKTFHGLIIKDPVYLDIYDFKWINVKLVIQEVKLILKTYQKDGSGIRANHPRSNEHEKII